MTDKQIWEIIKSTLNAAELEIEQPRLDQFKADIDRFLSLNDDSAVYKLYTDGAARGNPGPAGIGIVIKDKTGKVVKEHFKFVGECTNNVAEYMALLEGLQLVSQMGGQQVSVFSDSELMTKQLNGEYKVKNKALIDLYTRVHQHMNGFNKVEINHIKRNLNAGADRLANMAIDALK